MDRETELETELETEFNSVSRNLAPPFPPNSSFLMAVHHSSRFVFSRSGDLFSFPQHPTPTPCNKTRNPQIIPTKKPQNLNPSLRLVAPVDRLVPTSIPFDRLVSPSGRASWSLWCSALAVWSRWSPFLRLVVLPGLAVSLWSLRLVARPVDRLVPTRPSRSIVSSLRLVVRAGLSGALLWPSGRGGLRFSIWSCYLVSPSLWSLRLVAPVSFIADISRSLWSLIRIRWDDALPEDLVRAAYDRLAGTRYTALMHKLKKNRVRRFMLRDEAWRRYLRCGRARTSGLGLGKRRRIGTLRSKALGLDPRSTVVVPCDSSETPPSVNDLYLHLHTVNHDGTTFIDTRSERFYVSSERTSGGDPSYTEQSVDDEAVYLNVAGECSKGRVYGLGSVGRKKRRYGTPGASTSQTPDVVRGRVRCRCGATTKGYELHASASWDGHGRNRPSSATTTTTATNTATS
ncbi:hypothetical protein Sjap_002591 [Stephania japonica]|uniref:Uncharacterized protein n=1 Tax=Stephania japonica TaxID=461633 RepID=A0AAP0PW94_9MAGN